LGKKVAEEIPVPVIGIGAGRHCDGQVQVIADLLGLLKEKTPKHAKRYAEVYDIAYDAIARYVQDVRENRFPEEGNVFGDA